MDINIASFIVGVIGLVLAAVGLILYLKSTETIAPICYFVSQSIIETASESVSKIKLFYDNAQVDRVSKTYVCIWNNGRKPITKLDIPTPENMKILLLDPHDKISLLDFKVLEASRPEINFGITKVNHNSVRYHFDFLDYHDGVTLELLHTGSETTDLIITGTLLRVPQGIKPKRVDPLVFSRLSEPDFGKFRRRRRAALITWLILTLLMVVVSIIDLRFMYTQFRRDFTTIYIVATLFFLFGVVAVLAELKPIPEKLRLRVF